MTLCRCEYAKGITGTDENTVPSSRLITTVSGIPGCQLSYVIDRETPFSNGWGLDFKSRVLPCVTKTDVNTDLFRFLTHLYKSWIRIFTKVEDKTTKSVTQDASGCPVPLQRHTWHTGSKTLRRGRRVFLSKTKIGTSNPMVDVKIKFL